MVTVGGLWVRVIVDWFTVIVMWCVLVVVGHFRWCWGRQGGFYVSKLKNWVAGGQLLLNVGGCI